MIPEPDKALTADEVARWTFTRMAAGLIRRGIPVDQVMLDARQGCDLAGASRRPAPGVPVTPRIKVLRSVYETKDLPPNERIREILNFLDGRALAKAKRMIDGLEQHEARRVLDQAITDEKL